MDALLILACLIACALVLILLPVTLLYVIPVHSILRVTREEKSSQETTLVTWWFLGVRILHDLQGTRAELLACQHVLYTYAFTPSEKPGSRSGAKDTPVHSFPRNSVDTRVVYGLIRLFGSLGPVFWHESRFTEMRGRITLGLGDPALTGTFYGYYWATRFLLKAMRINLEMEPVFDRKVFLYDIEVRMSLYHPLLIVVAAIRLMPDPAVRDSAAAIRQGTPGAAGVWA